MTPNEFFERRLRLGLSQQQLADAFGYTDRQIRNYESGKQPVPPIVVLALKALDDQAEADTTAVAGYAVYDSEAVIWGIGDRPLGALLDAKTHLGDDEALYGTETHLAPMTAELREAVERHGGCVGFVKRDDGVLDVAP